MLYNLVKAPLLLMIPFAGMVCGLLGLGMGYLTLRLRGVFFAIATLALAIVLETLVVNWDYVGGATGRLHPAGAQDRAVRRLRRVPVLRDVSARDLRRRGRVRRRGCPRTRWSSSTISGHEARVDVASRRRPVKLGFFTMPVHRLDRDYTEVLQEVREAVILADRLGYSEAYVGEHVTDAAESITNSMLFQASLISDTRQIKLGTGTTNLSHTHPVLVAAHAAMLDHLLKGRFLFGVSPGALEPDAEALGIRGIDRNEMFAESIGHIIDIWRGEPPYDLEGKYWKISTRETLHPEIGVGPIPKPYQKPHTAHPRDGGRSVLERRDRDGEEGLSADLGELPFWTSGSGPTGPTTSGMRRSRTGRESAGLARGPVDFRSRRSQEPPSTMARTTQRSPYRYYFNQLFTKLKKANRHARLQARGAISPMTS